MLCAVEANKSVKTGFREWVSGEDPEGEREWDAAVPAHQREDLRRGEVIVRVHNLEEGVVPKQRQGGSYQWSGGIEAAVEWVPERVGLEV
jgi:hypothetical protein